MHPLVICSACEGTELYRCEVASLPAMPRMTVAVFLMMHFMLISSMRPVAKPVRFRAPCEENDDWTEWVAEKAPSMTGETLFASWCVSKKLWDSGTQAANLAASIATLWESLSDNWALNEQYDCGQTSSARVCLGASSCNDLLSATLYSLCK